MQLIKKRNLSTLKSTTDSSYQQNLADAKKDIDTILFHLNYQTDPDLIDSYTYQLKGAYLKYKFFLNKLQEQG